VLTWGRRDDSPPFVDSDLSFVLFRLPIAGPVWWGGDRRFVNRSEGAREIKTGVSGHAKRNKNWHFQVAHHLLRSLNSTHSLKMVSALRASLKRVQCSLYHPRAIFADNNRLDRHSLPTLCGFSPPLINSFEAAYAQGASRRAHPCCPGAGARACLDTAMRCAGTQMSVIDVSFAHIGQGGPCPAREEGLRTRPR
jgi:hypothetical protein